MRALRTTRNGYVNGWSVPVLLIGLFGVVVWVYAGDLDPPPGPIGPTMKTLDQVEARTPVQALAGDGSALHVISEPGSYYLTGAITGEAGKDGIRIGASDVNLDLNGFALRGVAGSGNGIRVVSTDGEDIQIKGVGVRNGVVRSWGANGVLIEGLVEPGGSRGTADSVGWRSTGANEERPPTHPERSMANPPMGGRGFSDMDVLFAVVIADNAGHGLVAGDYVHLEEVSLVNNAGNGAVLGSYLHMEQVSFTGNGGLGLEADSHVYMEEVSFNANGGGGALLETYYHMEQVSFIYNGGIGLVGQDHGRIRESDFLFNIGDGAVLGSHIGMEEVDFCYNFGCGLRNETYRHMEQVSFVGNTESGSVAGANCTGRWCLAVGNGGDGLVLGRGAVLEEVLSIGNAGHGVVAQNQGSRIMTNVDAYGTTCSGNGGSGFVVEGACNLRNCIATDNNADGIDVAAGSRIQDCSAHGNGANGIEVSDNCHVVGNVVRANGETGPHAGIQVTGSHNRIEGNDATGNNNVGIGVADAGNVIIRNCCAGNQVNFSIVVGNISGSVTTPLMGRSDGRGGSADYGNVNFDLP